MGQVPAALDYLHSHGIIHRNIKPANILYDSNYSSDQQQEVLNFYVADFGVSIAARETAGKGAAGTIFYMPPEAVAVGNTSPAFDIWSLGITIGCVLGHWCHKEMEISTDRRNQKLEGYGSTHRLTGPESQELEVRWPIRIRSITSCLHITLQKMLAPKEERSSPADVLKDGHLLLRLSIQPRVLAAQPQTPRKHHPNDSMSLDGGSSGEGNQQQRDAGSAMDIDSSYSEKRNSPARLTQPSGNQGAQVGAFPPPGNGNRVTQDDAVPLLGMGAEVLKPDPAHRSIDFPTPERLKIKEPQAVGMYLPIGQTTGRDDSKQQVILRLFEQLH